jgi:hypothetical protein
MARAKRWIQGAIKRPGSFTAKAKAAGRSVQAHAAHIIATDGQRHGLRTFRQAVLAKTLSRVTKRRSPAQRSASARKAARTRARRR